MSLQDSIQVTTLSLWQIFVNAHFLLSVVKIRLKIKYRIDFKAMQKLFFSFMKKITEVNTVKTLAQVAQYFILHTINWEMCQ